MPELGWHRGFDPLCLELFYVVTFGFLLRDALSSRQSVAAPLVVGAAAVGMVVGMTFLRMFYVTGIGAPLVLDALAAVPAVMIGAYVTVRRRSGKRRPGPRP